MNNWNMLSAQRRGTAWAREMADDMGGFQFMDNSTSSVINNLKFDVAKQVRSMIIILAGFNIAMALVLAVVIFRNCYKAAKRSDPSLRFRSSLFNILEATEIFPFVLSIGIIAQGIVYVVSQTKGLEGLLILGCTSISRAMFPALFLVPYIQLLFGLETTVQALRRQPFQRQSKWTILACVLIAMIGTVAMYVVTRVIKPPDFCYASLFWFVQTWRVESFALLTAIACTLIIGAIIIFVRLHQDTSIGVIERAAASRMVYYMILGAIVNGLMAPFFFSISSQNPLALTQIQLRLNMVASVASNVSGITFGVLYLFLRYHDAHKIGPLGHIELGSSRKEKTVESWPGTDMFNTQIEQPVSPARIFASRASTRRSDASGEMAESTNGERGSRIGTAHTTSNGDAADDSYLMNTPPTPVVARTRKDSYSLFPSQRETPDIKAKNAVILPSTTYSPTGSGHNAALDSEAVEELLLPPTIRISGAPRHNRDSSLVSSATVQIGLRVSNLSDVTRLEAPFFLSPDGPFSPSRLNAPMEPSVAVHSLKTATSHFDNVPLDDEYDSVARSPIGIAIELGPHDDKPITLSPTVYNPNNAVASSGTTHHKDVASNPSSPGIAMTTDHYSVGTAEWI